MNWNHKGTAGHEIHGQSAVYDEQTGKTIALVYDGKAHAAKIAATPELTEALRELVLAWANEPLHISSDDGRRLRAMSKATDLVTRIDKAEVQS